jgi:hypothetical protein
VKRLIEMANEADLTNLKTFIEKIWLQTLISKERHHTSNVNRLLVGGSS